MIDTSDYQNDYIYGTLKNNKVVLETEANALFIKCNLQIDYNGESWIHNFEIPFFDNIAEFYFENYVHSFLTQEFSFGPYNPSAINVFGFNFSDITINIEEWDDSSLLDSLSYSFKMLLGTFDELDDSVLSTQKILLNPIQSKFHSIQSTLTFSLISPVSPEAVIVTTAEGTEEELITSAAFAYPYTITVPLALFIDEDTEAFSVAIRFPDESVIDFGEFIVNDNVSDHNLVAYQNEVGTLSFLEFYGEFINEEEFKIQIQEFTENYTSDLRESDISESFPIQLNTGYILDKEKYGMLKNLISSFNKYLLNSSNLLKIVNDGTQRLTPYITDTYIKEETLKFKMATNGNSQNRLF